MEVRCTPVFLWNFFFFFLGPLFCSRITYAQCLCCPFSEVLKQVWDLSDQDNDSTLSLREFCFALYLMERYREGRPLPAALPPNVMFDETLLAMTGQPKVSYGNAAWGPRPGIGQICFNTFHFLLSFQIYVS